MFSALTSDFKKACGGRHVHRVWTHMAHLLRGRSKNINTWIIPEPAETKHHVCCVSPWSGGLRRGPPKASQTRRPSSAHRWLGRPLRPESLEGWSYCLRSPAQTCSALQHIQTQTHPFINTEKHDQEQDWIRYFLPSCTDMFQFVEMWDGQDCQRARWLFMLTSVWHCLALWT